MLIFCNIRLIEWQPHGITAQKGFKIEYNEKRKILRFGFIIITFSVDAV